MLSGRSGPGWAGFVLKKKHSVKSFPNWVGFDRKISKHYKQFKF